MKREDNITFRQSISDFPLMVNLGNKNPSFGLHRYKEPLRFLPLDDEGFALQGDKRQLLYIGRKRSHRFTILGDTSFEYDCILEREPESNVISLLIEGAENYDFFRQPDYVRDPFLKGSFAVYRKITILGEGTGKLCHIHRPEIIDARGRRCWGELSIVRNELRITIPEWWLSEAKYPVLVDPTIGTTTVGSQVKYEFSPGYIEDFLYDESVTTERAYITETINGTCTIYMYARAGLYGHLSGINGGRGVIYSDNNNFPYLRLTSRGTLINTDINSNNPAGWRSGTFNSNGSISGGSYIWYGIVTEYIWETYFDYSSRMVITYPDLDEDENLVGPLVFPTQQYSYWEDNKRPSMYITYNVAQNYIRTMTQGVKLSDSRKPSVGFMRKLLQTTRINTVLSRFETFYRKSTLTVNSIMHMNRYPVFLRTVIEQIDISSVIDQVRSLFRECVDIIEPYSVLSRIHSAIRFAEDFLYGIDSLPVEVLFIRSVSDNTTVSQQNYHFGDFIRGLSVYAENTDETRHSADYHRRNEDGVQVIGTVLRGLLFFVRIITNVFIRDYFLGRFLIAREELKLKSVICRELTFDSRID